MYLDEYSFRSASLVHYSSTLLTCPPKTVPRTMTVLRVATCLTGRREGGLDAKESLLRRADRRGPERACGGGLDPGALPALRPQPGDAVPLDAQVRRAGGERRPAAAGAGGGEPAAQAAGGWGR